MTKAYMFEDNKSVVMSSTIPQSILNKRHNMLSYHRVREAIAAEILEFHWCSSSQNRSDILSKNWDYMEVKDTVRGSCDYQGDIILLKPDWWSSSSRRGVACFYPILVALMTLPRHR